METFDEINNDNLHEFYKSPYMEVLNHGFMIPRLGVSTPLYRYRSNIGYAIDEIAKSYIYLSELDTLNDPFDSTCKITLEEALETVNELAYYWLSCYFLRDEAWHKELDDYIKTENIGNKKMTMREAFDYISSEITKRGSSISAAALCKTFYKTASNRAFRHNFGRVACFSEVSDSLTMWAYYADSHKGMCFKYEPCQLDASDSFNRSLIESICKVWYTDIRFEDANNLCAPFVKAQVWSHEKEWRLYRKFGEPKVYFPCLTEVYLGVNFDYNYLDSVITAIKDSKHDIKLYQYRTSLTTYSLNRTQIII